MFKKQPELGTKKSKKLYELQKKEYGIPKNTLFPLTIILKMQHELLIVISEEERENVMENMRKDLEMIMKIKSIKNKVLYSLLFSNALSFLDDLVLEHRTEFTFCLSNYNDAFHFSASMKKVEGNVSKYLLS